MSRIFICLAALALFFVGTPQSASAHTSALDDFVDVATSVIRQATSPCYCGWTPRFARSHHSFHRSSFVRSRHYAYRNVYVAPHRYARRNVYIAPRCRSDYRSHRRYH